MRANSPNGFGVTFFQLVPPFRVTCTYPSSDPVQMTLASRADGAMPNTVAYVSTPVLSLVIGPPEAPIVFGSWRVRSGLIFVQLCPPFVDFQTCCEPTYSTGTEVGLAFKPPTSVPETGAS